MRRTTAIIIASSAYHCQAQGPGGGGVVPEYIFPSAAPSFLTEDELTRVPTFSPNAQPTNLPTSQPSLRPTLRPPPTLQPTLRSTQKPSRVPTSWPTTRPTQAPSTAPPLSLPSTNPTNAPSNIPSLLPSLRPTTTKTIVSSEVPSFKTEEEEVDNLAFCRETKQSSTLFENYSESYKAVDGITEPFYTTTYGQETNSNDFGAWWQVNLCAECCIQQVIVYNRFDATCPEQLPMFNCGQRLNQVTIEVLDAAENIVDTDQHDPNAVDLSLTPVWYSKVFNTSGSRVQLILPADRQGLNLAEVVVTPCEGTTCPCTESCNYLTTGNCAGFTCGRSSTNSTGDGGGPLVASNTPSSAPTVLRTPSPTRSFRPSPQPSNSPAPTIQWTPWPTPTRREPPDNDDDDDDNNTGGVFVAVMAGLFVIAVCCGCNRGRAEIENFSDAETAVQEFKQDLLSHRILVFTTPCDQQTRALFFSTRIKRRWKPMLTYCQFIFGWISFFSTVVGFFVPENRGNSIVGCGALFINEILLHIWYGYFRYPNLVTGGEEDGFFEDIKCLFSILYHQDEEDHWERWVDWVCFPFTLVLHLGTVFGMCAGYLSCGLLRMTDDDDNGRRRRRRDDDSASGDHAFALLVGALVGSFAYPLVFLLAKGSVLKFLAAYAHHIVEEYYEAKLFNKSGREFLKKVVFSVLGDMVGIDGIEGIDEAVDDAAEPDKPELSKDDFDSQSIRKDSAQANNTSSRRLEDLTESTVFSYSESVEKEEAHLHQGDAFNSEEEKKAEFTVVRPDKFTIRRPSGAANSDDNDGNNNDVAKEKNVVVVPSDKTVLNDPRNQQAPECDTPLDTPSDTPKASSADDSGSVASASSSSSSLEDSSDDSSSTSSSSSSSSSENDDGSSFSNGEHFVSSESSGGLASGGSSTCSSRQWEDSEDADSAVSSSSSSTSSSSHSAATAVSF